MRCGELHTEYDMILTPDGWYVVERIDHQNASGPHYGLRRAGPFEIRDAHMTATAERG